MSAATFRRYGRPTPSQFTTLDQRCTLRSLKGCGPHHAALPSNNTKLSRATAARHGEAYRKTTDLSLFGAAAYVAFHLLLLQRFRRRAASIPSHFTTLWPTSCSSLAQRLRSTLTKAQGVVSDIIHSLWCRQSVCCDESDGRNPFLEALSCINVSGRLATTSTLSYFTTLDQRRILGSLRDCGLR
jgi:hypothetical protein